MIGGDTDGKSIERYIEMLEAIVGIVGTIITIISIIVIMISIVQTARKKKTLPASRPKASFATGLLLDYVNPSLRSFDSAHLDTGQSLI